MRATRYPILHQLGLKPCIVRPSRSIRRELPDIFIIIMSSRILDWFDHLNKYKDLLQSLNRVHLQQLILIVTVEFPAD